MSARKNKDTFLEQLRAIYGDKYDYSHIVYVNNQTRVEVVCPVHGSFFKTPKHLLRGQGCPVCSKLESVKKRSSNTELFIEKATKIHKGKYDYSKVEYKDNETKVCIICPEHGEFWQTPHNHLAGQGCAKCSGRFHADAEYFIGKATKMHKGKYDYSRVEYKDGKTKVCIICPIHGEFWQTPQEHLQGKGCFMCGNESMKKLNSLTTDEFIRKAEKVHGNKYLYDDVNYVNSNTIVDIICPEHGVFKQKPLVHLNGFGCSKCSNLYHYTTDEFIEKSKEIHGGKYDYSRVDYVNSHTKVCIICPEHGEFWQRAYERIQGRGCPKCSHLVSKAENELYDFVKGLGGNVTNRERCVIPPYELDIYIPDKRIAIEYDGLIWHSEKFRKDKNYHLDKTEMCERQGIRLIHIFEDEWLEHEDIVKSKLRHIFGCDNDLPKVYARKCVIKTVDSNVAKQFLVNNHIQGYSRSSVYLGCFYKDGLVGVMSFKREYKDSDKWELTRFATDITRHCIGIGGKLFKHFVSNYNTSEIKSFADRRWSSLIEGNLYDKIGFKMESVLKPDYHYVVNNKRLHKFGFRKKILLKKYPNIVNNGMTEHEMAKKLDFPRIYDCGLIKYIWKAYE